MIQDYAITIAVVDDDPFWQACLTQLLSDMGYNQVYSYPSAEACLANRRHRPDLIFLDQKLEAMNGLEALQIIHWQLPDTVVVFCTGCEDLKLAVNAMKSGAADFLQKSRINRITMERLMDQLFERFVFADKVY